MNPRVVNMNRKIRSLIAICAMLLSFYQVQSQQQIELRGYLGQTYYQGDLSPLPIALSFSKGHTAFAASAGFKLNGLLSLHGKFMKAKLSGTDADAANIVRRRRNLSFESNIYELGVHTELSFNAIFKGLDKYGIQFYATSGVNVFRFNPRAFYDEQWYALQPLGTEGQGENNGLDKGGKYSLTQLNIPYGIGTKFNIGDRFALGIEITARVTFTDYIDDVSGTYVSYEELLNSNGRDSANLANRTGEFLGSDVVMSNTGDRGDSSDNDWYLYTGMFFSYTMGVTPTSLMRRK